MFRCGVERFDSFGLWKALYGRWIELTRETREVAKMSEYPGASKVSPLH